MPYKKAATYKMPVALESKTNTSMLLRVQEDVLEAHPVVHFDFPAATPDAFALLEGDAKGGLTWLTQYINALVPAPNLVHYMKGSCAADGSCSFDQSDQVELSPHASKVVYALVLKVRTYSATDVAAVYAQASVTYDPAQPLAQRWTAGPVEAFGDQADTINLQLSLQRTVLSTVLVSVTGSGVPGNWVEADLIVFDPTGVPSP